MNFYKCEHGNIYASLEKLKVIETIRLCDISNNTFINNKEFDYGVELKFINYENDVTHTDTIDVSNDINDENDTIIIIEMMVDRNGNNIRYVDDKFINESLLVRAVKSNPFSLKYISKQTYELCMIAIGENSNAIAYADISIIDIEDIQIKAIRINPFILRFIKNPSYDICMQAIKLNGNLIQDVPKHLQNEEICMIAINQSIESFSHMSFYSEDLAIYVINKCPKMFEYIDVSFQNEYICELAVKNDYTNLVFVNNKTYDLCMLAYNINVNALQFIPKEYHTYDLCLNAVNINGSLLEYIDIKYKTEQLCKIAVENNAFAIKYVPQQTEELCMIALRNYRYMFSDIKYKNENVCHEAIKLCPSNLKHVNKKHQTKKLCLVAIELDSCTIQYVKNPTIEMWIIALKDNIHNIHIATDINKLIEDLKKANEYELAKKIYEYINISKLQMTH
jgi:hypothetical protein